MRDHERLNRPVIVPLPAEIDMANEEDVGEQLRAAFAPGVTVVIADLGSTVFCDCSGVRQLVLAHKRAVASNRELRMVISSAGCSASWRFWELIASGRSTRTSQRPSRQDSRPTAKAMCQPDTACVLAVRQ